MEYISRRDFLFRTSITAASLMASPLMGQNSNCKKFKMKFAPRGLFRASSEKNPFKYLKWISENGFRAVEGLVFCMPMKVYTKEEQEHQTRLGEVAKEYGLEISNISSMNEKYFPTMTANQVPDKSKVIRSRKAIREFLHFQLENTLAVMRRIGSKAFIIGAGTVDKELSPEKQYENVVENMSFCADYCKRHGVIMEIEPLNTQIHPNMYCDRATVGAKIARDVNSPHCKLLFDLFHEQMQVGNLNALDDPQVWEQIESFHVADAPSRQEPGTGNIPYKQILKKIWDKGFRGFIGLEHGQSDKSKEGDLKLLEVYRDLDSVTA